MTESVSKKINKIHLAKKIETFLLSADRFFNKQKHSEITIETMEELI